MVVEEEEEEEEEESLFRADAVNEEDPERDRTRRRRRRRGLFKADEKVGVEGFFHVPGKHTAKYGIRHSVRAGLASPSIPSVRTISNTITEYAIQFARVCGVVYAFRCTHTLTRTHTHGVSMCVCVHMQCE